MNYEHKYYLKSNIIQMQKHQTTLWLDCDPGLDDTFAIIYAAYAKQFHLLGISTSPGNTTLANTTQNALDILYNIGKTQIPVFAGSNTLIKGEMKLAQKVHGSNGLGGVQLPQSPKTAITENSFQKIYTRIWEHKESIIWVNTGSLTNLCTLLLSYPNIKTKITQIVMMGGAIGRGNITPAAEFNIFFDPHAFDQVLKLKSAIPLVMIPLEVTHQNQATQEVLDHFKKHQHIPFANAIHNMLLQFQEGYYRIFKFPFPPIHDPCTLFYILHPEQFVVAPATIEVDTFPCSYGRTNCYFSDPQHPSLQTQTNNSVATHFKNEHTKFWVQMLNILDQIFSENIQKQILPANL